MFSVAPVLSPALKELLHAQLPLLQLFMDPFSQLVVLPTSEGQDPFPWVLCAQERGSKTTGIPAKAGG